ncbi:hypothetical protein VOLCADRAFT_96865 [Volvox carteri f. nagariensis]|uniref:Cytochrome P450 n=1 Tax=Volvox carteri f. nagariensis TaxID=3068 RepID=D8UBI0_VOLCA|nr:uncharacterized protein VOLCADRAFT_96865 [Volvox carteri f. nagariensis]EFJ42950.1 hypothetical protein VOLCADRAFT_96865 [Volvox carteri f. nagariensis]|eukprot:XP_002955990.1 hypothetical protein VOLCADRAFT_96865 [Volvox carteri f. nagariensis]
MYGRKPKYDLDLIPGPWTHALPFIGNLLQFLRPDFHRVCLRWADKYGGIVRIKFLWHDGLLVTDPPALAAICGRGEGAVDKAANIYSPINQMCTPHAYPNLLTSLADDRWRAVRKAIALSFAFGNIRKKFPLIRDRTGELLEWLRGVGPLESVDVDQAALRVTLDVIGLSAFGHDYGCTRLQQVPYNHLLRVLPRAFTEVMRRIANPFRSFAPGLVKNGKKGLTSFKDFQRHMQELLGEIKARGPPARGDADIGAQLYRVLEAARVEAEEKQQQNGKSGRRWWWRKPKPAITDERILSEIGILFVEGFETTGHTISWTLFNIATTPGTQEAVAEELSSLGLLVRPKSEGGRSAARQLELDDLKRLRYLTACVKESMRMYPVVSIMGRTTDKPTRVGPYVVPSGTPVATALFAIHNTIHNWRDPMTFKPERWLDVPLESYVLDMRAKEGIPMSDGPASPMAGEHAVAAKNQHQASSAAAPAGPLESNGNSAAAAAANGTGTTTRMRTTPSGSSGSDEYDDVNGGGGGGVDADGDLLGGGGGAGRRTGISFMPFSEGPRSCVGQSLAKLEVMTVLAMLLANFRIELSDEMGGREGVRQRESTHLTLQTRGTRGIRMHLHPRDQE